MGKKAFELQELTIRGAQAAIASGETSYAALVREYLERIAALDKAGKTQLNAVILPNAAAADEAARLDAAFLAKGRMGPLHGVPILLKDNCETADMPTTAGSLSLKGWMTGRDAFIVEKLRKAGAVIVAKANLHEFAVWGETVSSILGQTRNPYDLTRTPGGSSGGTGAGLAANFALAGIGTDTVNSIRSPASACSLVGIRPTVGLVSRSGIVPYSLTQDTAGPLARSLEDAVRVLDVIAGPDDADPATAVSLGNKPESWLPHLDKTGLRGRRLGVLKGFFGHAPECEGVNAVMRAALAAAAAAGAELVPVNVAFDSAEFIKNVSVHLHDLKTHLDAYLAGFGGAAPVQSLAEILAGGKYTPDIEDNLCVAQSYTVGEGDYPQRMRRRAALQQQVLQILDGLELDALVYPHQQQPVCKVGETQAGRNGVLASITGYPAIVVPAGFTLPDANAPMGVPVGVEFMGRPWDEGRLIEVAGGFEKISPARRPPLFPQQPAVQTLEGLF